MSMDKAYNNTAAPEGTMNKPTKTYDNNTGMVIRFNPCCGIFVPKGLSRDQTVAEAITDERNTVIQLTDSHAFEMWLTDSKFTRLS